MKHLDDKTLYDLRRVAAAGATSPYLADRFGISVEQVEIVCGRCRFGERGTYGDWLPPVTEVDMQRDDPAIPFSYLPQYKGMPNASDCDVADIWQFRWEQKHGKRD